MLCPVEEGLGLTVSHCDTDSVNGGIFRHVSLSILIVCLKRIVLQVLADRRLLVWCHPARVCGADTDHTHAGKGKLLRVLLRIHFPTFCAYNPQVHSVVLALFASVVAPFGGFFASGFKRAFKIKDFSDAIPGHGGFTDRMDCQLIMGIHTHNSLKIMLFSNALLTGSFSYIYCHYLLKLGSGYLGGSTDVAVLFHRYVVTARAFRSVCTSFLRMQHRIPNVTRRRYSSARHALLLG
jgi:hypothetical protein